MFAMKIQALEREPFSDVSFSSREGRREALKAALPPSHLPYTDKYFIRSREILAAEGLNPFVRAQVFIRQGPGLVQGIEEALAILEKYSSLKEHGGAGVVSL